MELSNYVFSELREGELTLYRGSGDGLDPILLVGEYSSREGIVNLKTIPLIPLLQVGVALSCVPPMVAISVDFHLS